MDDLAIVAFPFAFVLKAIDLGGGDISGLTSTNVLRATRSGLFAAGAVSAVVVIAVVLVTLPITHNGAGGVTISAAIRAIQAPLSKSLEHLRDGLETVQLQAHIIVAF